MICYIKDCKDGWLTMKLQLWDDNKLIYESPEEKVDATYERAEDLAKMSCFMHFRKKLTVEDAHELIALIPTYNNEG